MYTQIRKKAGRLLGDHVESWIRLGLDLLGGTMRHCAASNSWHASLCWYTARMFTTAAT